MKRTLTAGVVAAFAASSSHAMSDAEAFCGLSGQLAYMFAEQRDAGVSRERLMAASTAQARSIGLDVEFVRSAVNGVFERPYFPPDVERGRVYENCLAALD